MPVIPGFVCPEIVSLISGSLFSVHVIINIGCCVIVVCLNIVAILFFFDCFHLIIYFGVVRFFDFDFDIFSFWNFWFWNFWNFGLFIFRFESEQKIGHATSMHLCH